MSSAGTRQRVTAEARATRRRGRPRSIPSSGAEPREEILRSAARLFTRKGIGATRMSDIAADVGVAAPSIYYHFENLDAIIEALLRFVVEESAAFATQEAQRPGPRAERLTSLIEQHVQRLASSTYDLWFVAGLTEEDARRFPSVARSARRWREAVVRLIELGVVEGEFRPVDPSLGLAMISGMVYGALQLRHEEGTVDAGAVASFVTASLIAPSRRRSVSPRR